MKNVIFAIVCGISFGLLIGALNFEVRKLISKTELLQAEVQKLSAYIDSVLSAFNHLHDLAMINQELAEANQKLAALNHEMLNDIIIKIAKAKND